jgi:hypothetical protein
MKIICQNLLFIGTLSFFLSSNAEAQDESRPKLELCQCWTFLDFALNNDADSLNFLKSQSEMPLFLNQYNLDWIEMHLWRHCLPSYSEGLSFRKSVLDRVNRTDVLEWIITSPNPNYDKKYVPEDVEKKIGNHFDTSFPGFPYMEFSWRDLARKRLSVLEYNMSRKK